ncbi:MAG: peptide deformylase [Bacilli bacterium]
MAVRALVNNTNEVLHTPARRVEKVDKKVKRLLDDLYETMVAFDGIGIAAPQVGVGLRVAIVDLEDENGTLELINPEIIRTGDVTHRDVEGCLSYPEVYGLVERPTTVVVQAMDRSGKRYEIAAEGLLARALMHEIDHLNGIVFTSKVTRYLSEEEMNEGTNEQ